MKSDKFGFKMREFSKPMTVLSGIGFGMLLFVFMFLMPMQVEHINQTERGEKETAQISSFGTVETGAWQNTEFTHLIDNRFGESLVFILQQYKISSITDLGCGTGAYVRMFEDQNIKTQGFDGNPDTKKWDVSGGLCVGQMLPCPLRLLSTSLRSMRKPLSTISSTVPDISSSSAGVCQDREERVLSTGNGEQMLFRK